MMRKVLCGIFILAICLQTGGGAFLYFWHKISNASFEKTFCINIERSQLKCHGQCKLSQLADQQQKQEPQKLPHLNFEEDNLRSVYINEANTNKNSAGILIHQASLSLAPALLHGRLYSQLVFHPPKAF